MRMRVLARRYYILYPWKQANTWCRQRYVELEAEAKEGVQGGGGREGMGRGERG